MTQYSSIYDTVQSTIHDILTNDTTLTALTTNILDGEPKNLMKGIGFPYVIINTPSISDENRLSLSNTTFGCNVIVPISVYDKVEKNVRRVSDAVRRALKSNQNTTRTQHLRWYKMERSNLGSMFLLGESSEKVWVNNMFFQYYWSGN